MCNAFYCRVQKSIFNNIKFAIFGDKYLSQNLIVILRNITQLCQVRQRGVGEGGEPSCDRMLAFMNTQCCFNVVPMWKTDGQHDVSLMVAHRLQHWADISPALAYQYIGLNTIKVHSMLA